MKVCFLFGSGASVPAGMPTVGEITHRVMSSDAPSPAPNGTDLDSQKEVRQKFLCWLEIQVKRRYVCELDRPVNYEDLYYLTSQILDDLSGEYDNPAVRPLIERAYSEVLPGIAGFEGGADEGMIRLTIDTTDYIRRWVMLLLKEQLRSLDYLEFVAEAFRSSNGRGLDILTLNHDTVLERFLVSRQMPIPFADGFVKEVNIVKVRQWRPETLREAKDVIRLLKLHGGVDWFGFRPDGVQDWSEDYVGIPTPEYLSKPLWDERQRQHSMLNEGFPIFLIGTFNKLASYTDSVYLEIYYQAFRSLEETDVLVVVGYGFGDKAINKLITNWICQKLERRLVVVGRDADSLWKRARGAIAGKWQGWLDAKPKRCFPLPFELEDRLSWSQVTNLLS